MDKAQQLPHISWAGPAPANRLEAYTLAMLVRVKAAGLDGDDEAPRDPTLPPSSLKLEDLHLVAVMFAFYRERIREEEIRTERALLKMIGDSGDEDVAKWSAKHPDEILKAEQELIDYVETEGWPGLRCFG